MSDVPEKSVADKLEGLIQDALDKRPAMFTPEEAKALRDVAARERAWQSIGLIAAMMRTILTYLGFFIGAWVAFKAGLLQWLAQELGR